MVETNEAQRPVTKGRVNEKRNGAVCAYQGACSGENICR
jgi:hypothetical protein